MDDFLKIETHIQQLLNEDYTFQTKDSNDSNQKKIFYLLNTLSQNLQRKHSEDLKIDQRIDVMLDEIQNLVGGQFDNELSVSDNNDKFDAIAVAINMVMEETRQKINSYILEKEKAVHASQVKTDFLSRMSHELRTPLNAILGFSQLLQMEKDCLNTEQYQRVCEINLAGKFLLGMINDILDLSLIETGNLYVHLSVISVNTVFTEAMNLLHSAAERANVKLISDFPDEDMRITANPLRLKQVLVNFISNAVKFNRADGEVICKIQKIENTVRLSVYDTGIGFSETKRELIFQPFERLDSGIFVEGTGIGLAVAKQLVLQMNGSIDVESEPGRGSHFYVDFTAL